MRTARELIWILANMCRIDWHDDGDVIVLDMDSRRPDDKGPLEDLQAWGQLIADGEPTNVIDENRHSCYTCEHLSVCFLKHKVYNLFTSEDNTWMFRDPPCRWMRIFDTLAEVCEQYRKIEQEATSE